jgi:hypothetical protein
MEIDLNGALMKFDKKIQRAWDEITFWVKRETSLTLLFWLLVLAGVLLKIVIDR